MAAPLNAPLTEASDRETQVLAEVAHATDFLAQWISPEELGGIRQDVAEGLLEDEEAAAFVDAATERAVDQSGERIVSRKR